MADDPAPAIFVSAPVPGDALVSAPGVLDDLRARFIDGGPADVPSEDEALPTGPVILAAVRGDLSDKRLRRLLVVSNRASLGLPMRPVAPRICLSCPDFAASWALTAVSGQQLQRARPPSTLHDVVAKPAPFPVGLNESPESSWPLNPLCYPVYSNASEGIDDIGSRCFVSMAGYRDAEPRLGEGFAHDSKRIARAGMTMKEALQTGDAAQFIAADLS